jgi:RNA polymerase sigma-70 factor (ECF subfamily)
MNDSEPLAHLAAAPQGGGFLTTHWSQVLEAGRNPHGDGHAALEELCRRYWFPLYAFSRKRGRTHADAQDLVQGFFAQLLQRDDLATVDPERGRFRTFLLTALTHYAANDWRRTRTEKRGGSICFESLEADTDLDERYREEFPREASAETVFDRAWAEQLLGVVLDRLREEFAQAGEGERFDALRECLLGASQGVPYTELGERLGLTEAGVKSAVHRMRRRFRELFREEIGRTVARREDIDGELRYLVQVMTR